VLSLIDLESSLPFRTGGGDIEDAAAEMDRLAIAVIAFEAQQTPMDGRPGYRWSYKSHEVVNRFPDRFALATNGGDNPNWTRQADGANSMIVQLERQAPKDEYRIFGEFEFRHYMSAQQCKGGRDDRDIKVPLESDNGRRLFKLAEETGKAVIIHLEPEDEELTSLDRTLAAFPKARIVVAHFGQLRHPERAKGYSAARIRDLMTRHRNLFYDISTGPPGRTYQCNGGIMDVALWQEGGYKGQLDTLKPEYKALLTDFSDRFVAGFDFGGGRKRLPVFIGERAANIRLIIRDLPEPARHAIAYRNAWKMLTGTDWPAAVTTTAR
jgi:hypothetical protein